MLGRQAAGGVRTQHASMRGLTSGRQSGMRSMPSQHLCTSGVGAQTAAMSALERRTAAACASCEAADANTHCRKPEFRNAPSTSEGRWPSPCTHNAV